MSRWAFCCCQNLKTSSYIHAFPNISAKSSVSTLRGPLLTSHGWVRWKYLTEYTHSFLCSNILAQGQNNYSVLLINVSLFELANALGYGTLHGLKLNNSASFKQNNISWACVVESPCCVVTQCYLSKFLVIAGTKEKKTTSWGLFVLV